MQFAKPLRDRIRTGEIKCSVRIWRSPRVKLGGLYRMGEGHVRVDSIKPIDITDITGELARRSGFQGVVDLLKMARHGSGTNVYLIEFTYIDRDDR